jgi:hypothetical protein
MQSRRLLVLAVAAAGFAGLASIAAAAPAQTFSAIGANVAGDTFLVPVHGCHRSLVYGWVDQWDDEAVHRHAGPNCSPTTRKADGYDGGRPPPGWERGRYRPGCTKIGPVWYCPPD